MLTAFTAGLSADESETNVSFKTYPKLIYYNHLIPYYVVQIERDSKTDVNSGRKKITDMVYIIIIN